MSVMVQIFHEVTDVIVLFNEAKLSWMEHLIFHQGKYLFHYMSEKNIHYLNKDSNFQTLFKRKSNEKLL